MAANAMRADSTLCPTLVQCSVPACFLDISSPALRSGTCGGKRYQDTPQYIDIQDISLNQLMLALTNVKTDVLQYPNQYHVFHSMIRPFSQRFLLPIHLLIYTHHVVMIADHRASSRKIITQQNSTFGCNCRLLFVTGKVFFKIILGLQYYPNMRQTGLKWIYWCTLSNICDKRYQRD